MERRVGSNVLSDSDYYKYILAVVSAENRWKKKQKNAVAVGRSEVRQTDRLSVGLYTLSVSP